MKSTFRLTTTSLIMIAIFSCLAGCKRHTKSTKSAIFVQTSKLVPYNFVDSIDIQGAIKSTSSATISAKTSGVVDVLNVGTGSKVKKGDIMFQVDKSNLEKKVTIEEQKLKVVKTELQSAIVDYKLAKLSLDKAKKDDERGRFLCKQKAISATSYESDHLAFLKAEGEVEKAKAKVANKMASVEQAENNLEIAKKDLKDSAVIAPFNGVVLKKDKKLGEYAKSSENIIKIEDLNSLQLVTRLSSTYYTQIIVNKTQAIVMIPGTTQTVKLPVTYKDPGIDLDSRTFEVDVKLPLHEKVVRGALCDAKIILSENKGWGIQENAIIECANEFKKVFIYDQGKAKGVFVKVGLLNNGIAQIINYKELRGKQIIITGQERLKDGTNIIVQDKPVVKTPLSTPAK